MAAKQADCRFLLVIDTHSDYESGELVHSRSKSTGQSLIAPIDEAGASDFSFTTVAHIMSQQMVNQFVSCDLRKAIATVGGMKGLVLLACRSSMTHDEHLKIVKNLVKRYLFHFFFHLNI